MKETVCAKIVLSGRVQGIGFRWFVKDVAQQENVYGYVRNNYDGSVEIVAECSAAVLEKFLHRIQTEHSYAKITDVKIEYQYPQGYKTFRIEF